MYLFKSRLSKCILFISFLSAAFFSFVWWLVWTPQGLTAAVSLAGRLAPFDLKLEGVSGRLCGPLTISRLEISDPDMDLQVNNLFIEWQPPQLLKKRLMVERIAAGNIVITEKGMGNLNAGSETTFSPVKSEDLHGIFKLPLFLQVQKGTIEKIAYRASGNGSPLVLRKISTDFSIKEGGLLINRLDLTAPGYNMSAWLKGSIDTLNSAIPLDLQLILKHNPLKTEPVKAEVNIKGNIKKFDVICRTDGAVKGALEARISKVLSKPEWNSSFHFETADFVRVGRMLPVGAVSIRGKSRGKIDSFSLNLSGTCRGSQLPVQAFLVLGQFENDIFQAKKIMFQGLGGSVSIHGQVEPGKIIKWNLVGDVKDVDPSVKWPGWKGRISGKFVSRGLWGETVRPDIHLDVTRLSGIINDNRFQAFAKAALQGDRYLLSALKIICGSSVMRLSGSMDKLSVKLAASIDSPDLSELLPGAEGRLNLHGTVDGSKKEPEIDLECAADHVRIMDISFNAMKGSLGLHAGSLYKGRLRADLSADSLKIKDLDLGLMTIRLDGTIQDNLIRADVSGGSLAGSLSVRGHLEKLRRYTGQLLNLNLAFMGQKWIQVRGSDFFISKQKNFIKDFCLREKGRAARICLGFFREKDTLQANLDLEDVDLETFSLVTERDFNISGTVNGSVNLKKDPGQAMIGTIFLETGSRNELSWLAGGVAQNKDFTGKLSGNIGLNGLEAELKVDFKNSGLVDGKIILPGWTPSGALDPEQQVKGRVNLKLEQLDFLEPFIPEIALLKGKVAMDVRITGYVRTLRVGGGAKMTGFGFEVPSLGIKVTSPHIRVRSQGRGVIYTGTFFSGDGKIEVKGGSHPKDGSWRTTVSLSGSDFRVADIPQLKAEISPNLSAVFSHDTGFLKGSLMVPTADIRPEVFKKDAVAPSQDLIIMDKHHDEKRQRLKLEADIKLILGKHVKLDGFGLRGNLRGELRIREKPGMMPVGNGALYVKKGSFKTMGMDLSLTKGRLLFSTTPVNNPEVDLEAVRKTDDVTAGFRINGSLRKPVLTLFSDPTLPDSEILSYIIGGDGKSSDSKLGAAIAGGANLLLSRVKGYFGLEDIQVKSGEEPEELSILLGKYLTPDLYVQFINNIGENAPIMKLKYRFSKRIKFQTESGDNPSADIFLTFEK